MSRKSILQTRVPKAARCSTVCVHGRTGDEEKYIAPLCERAAPAVKEKAGIGLGWRR